MGQDSFYEGASQQEQPEEHLIELSPEDLFDANLNIYAGIRWLFHKRRLASGKLGRQASWEEAVAEYKSLTRELKSKNAYDKEHAQELLRRFENYYKQYKECKKS